VTLSKVERIELRKKEIGSKHQRKLKRYSQKFDEIFYFFLQSYRVGILNFCGSVVSVDFQNDGVDSKEFYRLFENGNYSIKREDGTSIPSPVLLSRQNRICEAVLIGKKSWGLHVDMWSDGINEWCFTKEEILEQFHSKNIKIPESLLTDFCNRIESKRQKRNQEELERWYENGYLKRPEV